MPLLCSPPNWFSNLPHSHPYPAALGTLLALSAYRVLGSALSLLGGLCSITCSLVLPTAFYLRLSWGRLTLPRRVGLLAMLALGLALVCLVTGMNVCELLPACREKYLHPGGPAAGFALLPVA